MGIEIRLLGRFSVRLDGEEIPSAAFGGRLARTLVRVLLTRRGSFVSRDLLTESLWLDAPPSDPDMNLNVLVNRARRALGGPALILTGPGGYSFATGGRCVVDAELFQERLERGRAYLRAGRAGLALQELRSALNGWSGEPLAEDAYADWAREYRTTLQRAYQDALESAAAAAVEARDPTLAASLAERAILREPLREPAHLLLVRALAASGDTAGALGAFERLRYRLADELGLDPSPQATELQVSVLRGERLPSPQPQVTSLLVEAPPQEPAFVGRNAELDALRARLSRPVPGVVVVSGPAGSGKSRLLAEAAARSGRAVVGTAAFQSEQDEAWALARSLLREALTLDVGIAGVLSDRAARALADVLPELEELRPGAGPVADPESRRALALEGGVRLLEALSSRRAILLVDDLQWADATSLRFLRQVARRTPGLGLLLAYRPEEVPSYGALASFLDHLPGLAPDLLSLPLSGLPLEAISELFSEEDIAEAVLSETQGSPLAIAEAIRALSEGGVIECDAGGRWRGRIPAAVDVAHETARAGQRRAIQTRVARHPRRHREILPLLALLGREVPARVLAVAAGREQAGILHDLDALARASLVRLGDRGWTTQHQLVTESVADSLSRAERGRLHAMLAHALRIDEADLAELARHLAAAGDVDAAAEAFAQAALQSLECFANEEAERLADAGLDLRPRRSTRAALLEVRAEARARRGELSGARGDLAEAMRDRPPGPGRASILARMAVLTAGAEDYVRASELAELALAEAGSDRRARAQALTVAGRLDMNTNNLDRAEARSTEAVALFQEIGDARGVAEVLDNQANLAIHLGRLREAVPLLERVIRLLRDAGNLLRVGALLANYGRGLVMLQERPEEGLARIEEALELERSLGHPEGQAYCLWAQSEALVELGRSSEAEEHARAALGIARQLGHREWTAAALKSLGSVYLAAGDLDAAEAAFRESLDGAKDLPIFTSLAAAGLASVFLARHNLGAAEAYVTRALEEGTEFTRYEARLVRAQIAVARSDPNASGIVSEALRLAEAGGHVPSGVQLRELARHLSDRSGSGV